MADISFLQQIRNNLSEVENNLTDGISAIAPWITPLPSAALVANAVVQDLHWSPALGWVTAAIIESLGLTTVSTSLRLWDYNAAKRKTDPSAPFVLAASLVGVYLLSTIGLTVFLHIFPDLGRFAPVLFPFLALVGAVNLALRSAHRRRLESIAQDRADRKAERQTNRISEKVFTDPIMSNSTSIPVNFDGLLDRARQARKVLQANRLDNLVSLFRQHPDIGVTAAARALHISRQTVYTYLEQLEAGGRIRRGEQGIEVLEK